MKLTHKSFMLHFEETVTVGELKATVIANVMGNKTGFDIDFMDITNISYMGIDISDYQDWKKFREFHKEMGIDYYGHLLKKFNEIFTEEAIQKHVNKVTF